MLMILTNLAVEVDRLVVYGHCCTPTDRAVTDNICYPYLADVYPHIEPRWSFKCVVVVFSKYWDNLFGHAARNMSKFQW